MNVKLKTLKEMDLRCEDVCPKQCTSIGFIREEAIKDIKELKKVDCKERHLIGGNNRWSYSEEGKNAIINYISWKFNITEEDLK